MSFIPLFIVCQCISLHLIQRTVVYVTNKDLKFETCMRYTCTDDLCDLSETKRPHLVKMSSRIKVIDIKSRIECTTEQ